MLAQDNPPDPAVAPAPPPKLHDIKITRKKTYQCARVEGAPPEEFGFSRNARSIRDCGYCYHEVVKSQSDLISQGFDRAQLLTIPSHTSVSGSTESNARDTVDESQGAAGDDSLNQANREIKITEHYVRMDYEGDGKTRLYRVTTGGDDNIVLKRDGEDDIVEFDAIPFAAMTPVIMTHRVVGRSIADLVMDIQRIKTALLRGALDNMYLHINPRVEVSESHASDNTLDDLLVSRPGGIVRTKQPGGLNWQEVPDITPSIYPQLQYWDATREWRTGVSRQGQGVDPNALQNQVATIANQMFNAAQARIKMIARIFAETGIRDMFALLHGIIRKNGSQAQTVRLRNKWVNVDPREWKERNDMTINVGLGDGTKQEKLMGSQLLIGAQEKALAAGMVSKMNLWESAQELAKHLGHKNAERFFTPPDANDPASKQPIPMPDNPDIEKAKIEAQLGQQELSNRAEIEKVQAQADIASNNTKMQNEAAMQERKFQFDNAMAEKNFELERELKMLDAHLNVQKHQADMAQRDQQHAQSMQQGAADHEARQTETKTKQQPHNEMAQSMKDIVDRLAQIEAENSAPIEIVHDPKTKKAARIRKGSREITITRQ